MELTTLLKPYKDKKVLLTGHTGFKGSWLAIWLEALGAKVVGVAIDSINKKNNYNLSNVSDLLEKDYRQDIRDLEGVKKIFEKERPEIVFHLAAQPIVLESYKDPILTYETNVMGTVNILEACRLSPSVLVGVFITTDKCYENKEWIYPYREFDPMGGYDPYSSSKGASELIISSYRRSFFKEQKKNIASVRAGNVIGGGDWSPHRIVVDLIKAIESNMPLEVRNPEAVRPWQHVLEPLSGYLLLGAKMMEEPSKFDEAWNFGPEVNEVYSVRQLVEAIINAYGAGSWVDRSNDRKLHEANLLSLDISKAKKCLRWRPVLDFQETVKYTVDWYKFYQRTCVLKLCREQIQNFCKRWNFVNAN